jgi:hypothetical protein
VLLSDPPSPCTQFKADACLFFHSAPRMSSMHPWMWIFSMEQILPVANCLWPIYALVTGNLPGLSLFRMILVQRTWCLFEASAHQSSPYRGLPPAQPRLCAQWQHPSIFVQTTRITLTLRTVLVPQPAYFQSVQTALTTLRRIRKLTFYTFPSTARLS